MGTSALKHIADSLGITDAELGRTLGMIRLGAIPAFCWRRSPTDGRRRLPAPA
jgi:hypothetical protein